MELFKYCLQQPPILLEASTWCLFAGGVTGQRYSFRTGLRRVPLAQGKTGCVPPCPHRQVITSKHEKAHESTRHHCKCVMRAAGKWLRSKCNELHGYVCKRKTVSVLETPREPHYIGRCPEKWLYFGHKVQTHSWTCTQALFHRRTCTLFTVTQVYWNVSDLDLVFRVNKLMFRKS